ncbi:lipid A-modifier LpxR family protein [uncultured Maricaulis sp.]|uniref:lipid A-modifier LpxR family protein n=1 Tax=uncultured Maricaulis sp. TaxID=174710 RepID=UPI002605F75B|nr:lipid A-modifier LpxR family protein [uncultured Maricaulis sp.]
MRLGRTAEVMTAGLVALAGMSWVLVQPGQAESNWASATNMIRGPMATNGDVRPLSPEAARVALSALALDDDPFRGNPLAGLTPTGGSRIDLGDAGVIEVAVLEDDRQDHAHQLFAARGDGYSPVVLERGAREATIAVAYERAFETEGAGQELDVSFTPRAAVSVGPDGSATSAGAEVRVGQYLRHDNLSESPAWYVFAGADRRALMYNPAEGVDFQNAMYFTQREVIGDAQAGIAVRMGKADLSLAWVRREYRHVAGVRAFDETEEFGAVTVNWRW